MKSLFEYSYDFTRNFMIFHSSLSSNMSIKVCNIFGFQDFIKTLPALWSTYRSIKVYNFSFIPLEIDLVARRQSALLWLSNK